MKNLLIACIFAAVLVPAHVASATSEPVCLGEESRLAHPTGEGVLKLRVGEPLIIQGYDQTPAYTLHVDNDEIASAVTSLHEFGWALQVDLPSELEAGTVMELNLLGGESHTIELVAAAPQSDDALPQASLCHDERYTGQNTVRLPLAGHPNALLLEARVTQTGAQTRHLVPAGATGDLWLHLVLKDGCADLTVEDLATGTLATQQLCESTACWPSPESVLYVEDPAVALNLHGTPRSAEVPCPAFDHFEPEGSSDGCSAAPSSRGGWLGRLFLRR